MITVEHYLKRAHHSLLALAFSLKTTLQCLRQCPNVYKSFSNARCVYVCMTTQHHVFLCTPYLHSSYAVVCEYGCHNSWYSLNYDTCWLLERSTSLAPLADVEYDDNGGE